MAVELTEALAWLDGHIDLEKTAAIAGRSAGLSLERMQALVDVLGRPQDDQPTVHLTGTNGKGSTARILSSLLATHGLTVGTYTSPHLERLNERIARDGDPIADSELAAALSAVAAVEPLLEDPPSFFEVLTAAAYRWFSDVAVEAAVVEVGLLGRYDATNVVDGRVAVLTNVGYDHTDGLGDWRLRIADEKAGIVKPGATFVVGETDPALRPRFEATPAARRWIRDEDFGCTSNALAVGGRVLDLRTPGATYDQVFLPLHGAHQGDNAAIALAAAEAFLERPLDAEVVAAGLAGVRTPGRFEVVSRRPLVVLDGAHNRDGAEALARTLAEGFVTLGERRLVVGALAGRDPRELLGRLDPAAAAEVITCTPPSPRGLPAGELAQVVIELGGRPTAIDDVGTAVRTALDHAAAEDLVVVTGSLYTVGAARTALRDLGLV